MKSKLIKDYMKLVRQNMYKKYSTNTEKDYDLSVMNNILEKDKCHIVALFKEFLLYYDYMEFLKRFYKITETRSRLINISYFYKENLLFFPNYSPLMESNYLHHNIRRKQALKNKIIHDKKKMKKSKKNLKELNKNNNSKEIDNDNNFFTNKIYNELLDEGESFLNLLFGLEKKNNKDNNEKSVISKNEIEEEIEDYEKIIDNINYTENKKTKIINIFAGNPDKKKIKYIKPNVDDIYLQSNTKSEVKKNNANKNNKNNNINNNINNNSNSLFIRSMNNSTASGSNSVIHTIQNQKYNLKCIKCNIIRPNDLQKNEPIYQKIRINNNNISSKKDVLNENINIEGEKKQGNIVYHRKVKSTLLGDYSYKLDLPSNLSVVNSLKIANQKFAEKNKDSIIRVSLYKKIMKNKKINNKNPLSYNLTGLAGNRNETFNKESISEILKNIKAQMSKTPCGFEEKEKEKERKENAITKLSKIQGISKKIEMPFKTPIRIVHNKRKSPRHNRNLIPGISFNNSNSNKDINDNNNYATSVNNNQILNSYRKPENILKHIYIKNQKMSSPYSKPKPIIKEKKCIKIAGKKLFGNIYDNIINDKDDNKDDKNI